MGNHREPAGLYDPQYERDSCGVGFVADVQARPSHQIVTDGLEILARMNHRGARGSEPNTGDGAGILVALPYEFLSRKAKEDLGVRLPPRGRFGVGVVFLPKNQSERSECKSKFESLLRRSGHSVLGWRTVPTDSLGAGVGPSARASEPVIEQVFIQARAACEPSAFERELYLVRKHISHVLRTSVLGQARMFYICSLSSKVLIYKGQLLGSQLRGYFPDLSVPAFSSHVALVHARFSTNTFPSWDRAQPNRLTCHNGEINTLRGNINWMRAREGMLRSSVFGPRLNEIFPVVEPESSDSGSFDNVLEFLVMNGRSLPEAITMMIPEAWQNHASMPADRKAYYEYQSCLMEPWDGPAAMLFSDGECVGALLDRNGLRPGRFYETTDGRLVMASEVGVLPVPEDRVRRKGRLQPGRLFLLDFRQGRIIGDDEVKANLARMRPYGKWLRSGKLSLDSLEAKALPPSTSPEDLQELLTVFGYTVETLNFFLIPLSQEGRDPIGSMGNDASLACLSNEPRLLFDYFHQLFAQVTNPAIDPIREELVMSLRCFVGPEGNLLESTPEQCSRLEIPHPVLTNCQTRALRELGRPGWRSTTIDITWPVEEGTKGMMAALDRICFEAEKGIFEGSTLLILSDRQTSSSRVPIPSLLASSAVHQYLVRKWLRTRVGLIVETGEAREVHHFCLLFGYGADAVNPYLAYEALEKAHREGLLSGSVSVETAVQSYRQAVAKGILKVLAKMGISTLQSYKGAQIFEAVGLRETVIERCFTGTPSRVAGIGFNCIAEESLARHRAAFKEIPVASRLTLVNPGQIHWRSGGEKHAWSPEVISQLQQAAVANDRSAYRAFSDTLNHAAYRTTLRGLLTIDKDRVDPIPLEEVEPASQIVRRFCTGAMSLGSISPESHETLAIAMNRIGGRSNTGEGGEDPIRFQPLENGDSKRSSIKQIASGRFGVTLWYLINSDQIQIKIAQGAKPGEGGELPGHKVNTEIARIRHSTPGVGLISPPPHHDIYSIEDLKQLIFDLKNANPRSQVSVKLVSEMGVGTIAAGVAKAHADHIVISGHDGGTGASPLTSIKHAGLPWEMGLAETHQTLVLNDLRSRVRLQTDGGLKTGRDVVIAALLGAEEYAFSTAPLVTLGCIMMRKCHLNTCPVGIATQDPALRAKFRGLPEHVINYLFMVAEEVREYMGRMGFRTVDEMIGHSEYLVPEPCPEHRKACRIDLSRLLEPAHQLKPGTRVSNTMSQPSVLDQILDRRFVSTCLDQLQQKGKARVESAVANTDRAVGTFLSNQITEKFGQAGLPDGSIHLKLKGSAGQSLGAWLAPGITLELEGDANDYVGKGLAGGRIVVYPPKRSVYVPQENIIVGNVVLYGATAGEAYIRGQAGERFCVRNSGAVAVVEGVGEHGCEYMTGGKVVVLGSTGRNFAAGMSGGIGYVWDPASQFHQRCNTGLVRLTRVEEKDEIRLLQELIERHHRFTDSEVAGGILSDWESELPHFVKVLPVDYEKALRNSGKGKEAA